MGGSSSKKKKEEEEKLNKNNIVNDNQNEEKNNSIKKVISSKIIYEPEKDINPNVPIKTFQSKISEPIIDKKPKYPIFNEKDYNLEITNYFNSNIFISEEKNIFDNIYHNYQQTLYNIESKGISTNIKINNSLDEINKKINSYFGLKKSIKDDFDKTKANIVYCSTLTENDEILINMIDYNEYLKDEKKYKNVIKNVINNNINEMISKMK